MSYELAVVGAGPAGLAAVTEAKRLGFASILLLDRTGQAGGAIRAAHEVRNAPFLPDRIPGEAVAQHLEQLRSKLGVQLTRATVTCLRQDGERVLLCAASEVWTARAVVVATGARPRYPSIPGLPREFGGPVVARACEAIDGPVRRAVVIGGGDVAFDQARYLRARGIETTVLCRSRRARAPEWLVEQARLDGVNLMLEATVESGRITEGGVVLQVSSGPALQVDRVVAALGSSPCVPEGAEAAGHRWIVAGDATGRRARHLVAAMGDGCTAAFELLYTEGRER